MDEKSKMPIVDALKAYGDSGRLSFHIPGHKGRAVPGLDGLESALSYDITEIEGFDDLHHPEGIIKEAEELAAELYGADRTYFLVNGTTSGIMAAVASAAGEKQAVLIARDCHKSVIRGLVVSGASPVYIKPAVDRELGLAAGLSVELVRHAIETNPGVRAIVVTHPSYYGTYSDLREIARLAHEKGIIVIADEAHGAHLSFTDQYHLPSAMEAGVDIAVQSTHKLPGSLTQSSMLHIKRGLVNEDKLTYFVSLFTSTSPSYLLMASLDAVRHHMALEGRQIWTAQLELCQRTRTAIAAIDGIECPATYHGADGAELPLEGSRLLISAAGCGLGGRQLASILCEDYGIDVEFADDIYAIACSGSQSAAEDYDRLLAALEAISDRFFDKVSKSHDKNSVDSVNAIDINRSEGIDNSSDGECSNFASGKFYQSLLPARGDILMTPRMAAMSEHSVLELMESVGLPAAEDITVYPPGIPLLQPGEEITFEIVMYIKNAVAAGVHVHGVNAQADGRLMVKTAEDGRKEVLFNMMF